LKKWLDIAQRVGATHVRAFGGDTPTGATLDQAIGFAAETVKRGRRARRRSRPDPRRRGRRRHHADVSASAQGSGDRPTAALLLVARRLAILGEFAADSSL